MAHRTQTEACGRCAPFTIMPGRRTANFRPRIQSMQSIGTVKSVAILQWELATSKDGSSNWRPSNPIRREFHLFTLLSGCRPAALKEVEPSRVDFRRRMVHIPKPKGGAKRAFDIPLSREMIR